MSYRLPGDKSKALLDQGLPSLRDGLSYQRRAASSAEKGYAAPAQMIVGRAEGDFVWDVDDNRYIDLQNGWATNPLGNCHPEIIEAVASGAFAVWLPVGASAADTCGGENSIFDARGSITKVQF